MIVDKNTFVFFVPWNVADFLIKKFGKYGEKQTEKMTISPF